MFDAHAQQAENTCIICTLMQLKAHPDSLKNDVHFFIFSTMIKIILAAGFQGGVPFIFTAQAQVVSCVHMNDAKRSNSNINDKDRRVYFSPECGDGPSGDGAVLP